jgi:hypothetical protein
MAGKDQKKDQKKNKADLRGTKAAKPSPTAKPATKALKPAAAPAAAPSFIATTQPAGLAKCQDPKMIRPAKDMKCVKPGTRVFLTAAAPAPAAGKPVPVPQTRTFIATTQPAGLAKCQDPKMIRPAKDMKCVKPGTRVTVPVGPAAPAPAPTPAPAGKPVPAPVPQTRTFIATTQPAGLAKCQNPKMIRPAKDMKCVKPGTRVTVPVGPAAPAPMIPVTLPGLVPAPGTGTRTFIATTQPAGLAKCQNPKMIRPAKDMKCVKPGTRVTVPIGPAAPAPMIPVTVPGLAPGKKITDYDPNNLNIDYIPGQTSNVDNLGVAGPDSNYGTMAPSPSPAPMAPSPSPAPTPAPAPGTWRMAAAATDAAVGYVRDTYGSQGPFLSSVVPTAGPQMVGGLSTRVSVEDRGSRMTYVVDMSRGYGAGTVGTPWSATLVSSGLTAFVPSPGRTGSTTDYDPNNINVDYIPGQSVDVSNLGTAQPSSTMGELTMAQPAYAPMAQPAYAPMAQPAYAPQVYAPKGPALPTVMYNPNPDVNIDYIPGQSVDVSNLGTAQPDSPYGETVVVPTIETAPTTAPTTAPPMVVVAQPAAPRIVLAAPQIAAPQPAPSAPQPAPSAPQPAPSAPQPAPAAPQPAPAAPQPAPAPAPAPQPAPAAPEPAAPQPLVAPAPVQDMVVLVPKATTQNNTWKWLVLAALVGAAAWWWWSRRTAANTEVVNTTTNTEINTTANNAEIARLNAAIAAVNTAAAAIAPNTTGKK